MGLQKKDIQSQLVNYFQIPGNLSIFFSRTARYGPARQPDKITT